MKLEVGKCYELISDGIRRTFRVIRNESNISVYIRYCETGIEEEFFTETAEGGFSEDFTLKEIDCMDCDGKPTV